MSTKFESSIKQLNYPQQTVYGKMSDLRNLKTVAESAPKDKISSFTFSEDQVKVTVPGVGVICLRITDREAPKMIKFETSVSPVPFTLWVQLLPLTALTSKMKITVKTELNPFIGAMVSKPIQEAVDNIADVISRIPFNR